MNLKGLVLGGTAAVAAMGMLPAADAGVNVDVDVILGRHFPAPAPRPERVTRVWVPPVYRTVCDRVWVEPVYRTTYDRVWCEPVYQTVCENVYVPDRWEERTTRRWDGRRWVYCTERVLVERGHWAKVEKQVMVQPGRWDNVARQELASPGHFENVERQELVAAGHWEERVEQLAGPDWRPQPLPGWDIRVSNDRHDRYRH